MKRRDKLGKFRIECKLGEGGFAAVYRAYDTIEGIRVALKVPHPHLIDREMVDVFRKEAKVNARLDHPNVLPIKYAGFIDDRFVIVYPLGVETLGDRLTRRLSTSKALGWFEQMLEAVAYAHRKRILHLDLKPDNFIMFPGEKPRLADFGLARVGFHTMTASGSGTVGYLSPEQALGKPSPRSDVFCLGLIFYRMLTGVLPRWPFDWPPPGFDRLRRKLSPPMIEVVRKALEVDHRERFDDAPRMLAAFRKAASIARKGPARPRKRRPRKSAAPRWQEVRFREFRRLHGRTLDARFACSRCSGPVSEPMRTCPWCGKERRRHQDDTRFPARCPRCERGCKLDWRFCPWCYGRAFAEVSSRSYSDARYCARCPDCGSRQLMPFMKYCPSCNRKIRRRWKLDGLSDRCPRCGWGVLKGYWDHCPWCARSLAGR